MTWKCRSLREGGAEHGLEWRLLLDHSRRKPVERAQRTVELAAAHPEVAGIGVAGEERYSLTPFTEILAQAREIGLHLVHHAGEEEGPDSVREALGSGRAERLGHGIRILDDPELTAEVADRGIAPEVCPSSNVTLGLVPSWPEHPLPRLIEAGLAVTLSTDRRNHADRRIPPGTGSFRVRRLLARPAAAAVTASFAPEPVKTKLHKEIREWLSPGAAA